MLNSRPMGGAAPTRRVLLAAAGAGLVLPALLKPVPTRAADPVTLTVWSWITRQQEEIDLYQTLNPGVRIDFVNAGQGAAEYVKLRNALKAGAGLPDVAFIEYQMIDSFRMAGGLLDLAPYGAGSLKGDYAPWVWQQVSSGDKVYAIPGDSGPLGILYRNDIFETHNITPPATWDEFADAAVKLHRDAPDVFLTDAQFNAGLWAISLMWQAGSRPFHVEGDTIAITVNDAPARKMLAYWQKLIDAKAVDTAPGSTTEWYQSFDKGRYAAWITAAWGPIFLAQFAKNSAGQWRAAPIPQWQSGEPVSANFGGSSYAVMKASKHPQEAAAFVWMNHSQQALDVRMAKQFAFPTLTRYLNDPEFIARSYPFYGGQAVNKVFVESANAVDGSFQWSPFQDYVNAQFGNELSAAAGGKGTLLEALDRLQRNIVAYAKAQGFTVKT
jgi:multiple sugar transport system substrate-binding protein